MKRDGYCCGYCKAGNVVIRCPSTQNPGAFWPCRRCSQMPASHMQAKKFRHVTHLDIIIYFYSRTDLEELATLLTSAQLLGAIDFSTI